MARLRINLPLGLILAFGLGAIAPAAPADPGIAVIVAPSGPELPIDLATLRDIYLKKIVVDQAGHMLVPVNLPSGSALRRAFSLSLLHDTSEGLQNYWNERYFHGIRPPYVLGSQDAVLRFVSSTEGAIGYVASCRVNASVRSVLVLPAPADQIGAIQRLCAHTR